MWGKLFCNCWSVSRNKAYSFSKWRTLGYNFSP